MASNSEIIESLALEIDVSIKGQSDLKSFINDLDTLRNILKEIEPLLNSIKDFSFNYGGMPNGGGTDYTGSFGKDFEETYVNARKVSDEFNDCAESIKLLSGACESASSNVNGFVRDNITFNRPQLEGDFSRDGSIYIDWEEAADGAESFSNAMNDVGKSSDSLKEKLIFLSSFVRRELYKSFHNGLSKIQKLFKQFTRILTYRIIRGMLRTITEGFTEGVQNLARYSSNFNDLMSKWTTTTLYFKNALGTLSAPFLTVILPLLERSIELTIVGINHLNEFIAKVQGLGTYTVADPDLSGYWQDYAQSLDSASKSAKNLKNTLAGFDEINRLNDNSSTNIVDYSKMFKEKITEIQNDSFLGQLAMAFNDIFIDFQDLTGEQIFEKILAILGGLAGGVIGFAIGGVPGAIIGTIAGVTLALIVSGVIFNHDGKLTADEILQALIVVLGGIAGGVLGFMIGGPVGAAIGVTVGVGLALGLCALIFNKDGELSEGEILGSLIGVLGTVAGGVIGFSMGGPAGAAIGATVGIALSMGLIDLGIDKTTGDIDFNKLCTKLFIAALGIAAGAITFLATGGNPYMSITMGMLVYFSLEAFFKGRTLTEVGEDMRKGWEDGWEMWDGKTAITKSLGGIVGAICEMFGINTDTGLMSDIADWLIKVGDMFANWKVNIKVPHLSWDDSIGWEASGVVKKVLETLRLPTKIPGLKVDWYATGGFPEDGLFMANHGELVGKFANGRTAVANNEQIEAGIEEAAYRGFTRALSNATMGNNGGNYTFVAEIDGKTLFEEVVTQNNRDARQRGFNRLVTL